MLFTKTLLGIFDYESGFGFIVNRYSDSLGKSNKTVTYYEVAVVCLCCFRPILHILNF